MEVWSIGEILQKLANGELDVADHVLIRPTDGKSWIEDYGIPSTRAWVDEDENLVLYSGSVEVRLTHLNASSLLVWLEEVSNLQRFDNVHRKKAEIKEWIEPTTNSPATGMVSEGYVLLRNPNDSEAISIELGSLPRFLAWWDRMYYTGVF